MNEKLFTLNQAIKFASEFVMWLNDRTNVDWKILSDVLSNPTLTDEELLQHQDTLMRRFLKLKYNKEFLVWNCLNCDSKFIERELAPIDKIQYCDNCRNTRQPDLTEAIVEVLSLTKGTINMEYNHTRPHTVDATLNLEVIRTALQTLFNPK